MCTCGASKCERSIERFFENANIFLRKIPYLKRTLQSDISPQCDIRRDDTKKGKEGYLRSKKFRKEKAYLLFDLHEWATYELDREEGTQYNYKSADKECSRYSIEGSLYKKGSIYK